MWTPLTGCCVTKWERWGESTNRSGLLDLFSSDFSQLAPAEMMGKLVRYPEKINGKIIGLMKMGSFFGKTRVSDNVWLTCSLELVIYLGTRLQDESSRASSVRRTFRDFAQNNSQGASASEIMACIMIAAKKLVAVK